MQHLYRLVYYSRNLIVGGADSFHKEVDAILAASQRNNKEAGVTGALLFNAGCFGQVLEGLRPAVESTFERIQCDPRHGDVSLLAFEAATARTFPNWSMGFVSNRSNEGDAYSGMASQSGFDPSLMTGERLFETLHRLALEEERVPTA